jgi:hypothetical protein
LEKVKDIECDIHDKKLKFIITFKKSITKKIMKLIDESRESVYGSERFDADVDFSSDNVVTLRIYKR